MDMIRAYRLCGVFEIFNIFSRKRLFNDSLIIGASEDKDSLETLIKEFTNLTDKQTKITYPQSSLFSPTC